jgi:Ca-activated chloride channel family protein
MKRYFLAALVALLWAPLANAQSDQSNQPAAKPESSTQEAAQKTIRVQVNLVNVLATVTDKKDRMILDLTQDDFRLFEDKRPQTIKFFSREADLPLRIGVLIDTSNSVRERLHFEQEAAVDFLNEALRPGQDQAFVVGFDVEPQVVQDYTDDTDKLSAAVRGLAAGGTTALYDAIYYACKQKMLVPQPTEPYLRRVLIVVSDGRDNQSEHSREEALSMAQHSEAIIFAISTNNSGTNTAGSKTPNGYSAGDKTLLRLAEQTGGRVFFPFEASDLASNFQEIARELRSQYSIGYVSSNQAKDGTFRTIQIETATKGLRVRARAGYYAPGPANAASSSSK